MNRIRSALVTIGAAALLASSVMAQAQVWGIDGKFLGLLQAPDVQKDLGLTADQVRKANEAEGKAATRRREIDARIKGMDRAKVVDFMRTERAKLAAEYQKDLDAFLTPEQARKLRAITIARFSWAVFQDRDLRDELKLTEAQRARMDEIIRGGRVAMRDITRLSRDPKNRQDFAEQARKFDATMTENLVSVLTDEQKARWKAMKGEPAK